MVRVMVMVRVPRVRDSVIRWSLRHTNGTPNVWPKMPTVI